MLFLAFFVFLETSVAGDPAHLKHGAFSAHLGRAFLIEDVLWVNYHFPPLVEINSKLGVITEQLDVALSHPETFP